MRLKGLSLAIILAAVAVPIAAAEQDAPNPAHEREITLRGCVMPALNDTYILTDVTQTPGPGGVTPPPAA